VRLPVTDALTLAKALEREEGRKRPYLPPTNTRFSWSTQLA
jgi:hypothetical protein